MKGGIEMRNVAAASGKRLLPDRRFGPVRRERAAGGAQRLAGVSFIEVLVALVIISVGLLGIAKMQALAISSTRTAGVRSLIAVEAASLAASMQANPIYWAQVAGATTTFTASVNGATVASSDASMATSNTNCAATSCVGASPQATGAPMAAYDLSQWGLALQGVVPSATGTVACSGSPVTCIIGVTWQETYTGMNAATQLTTAAQTATQYYDLVVQP